MSRLPLLAAVVALAVAVALGIIGQVGAATTTVMATSSNTFNPSTATINVGDTVQWTGITGNHTVTSSSSNWSFRSVADTSFTFNAAGTYDYFCEIHAGMTGRVIAQQAGATNTPIPPTSTPGMPTATPTTGPAGSSGTLVALLIGAGQNPPVTTSGTGSVTLAFDANAGTVTGTWNATGLSSNLTAAHIHRGAPGTNGPIVIPFSNLPTNGGSFSTSNSGVDASLIREILGNPGGFYANIRTANNTSGEVRGPLQPPASCGTGTLNTTLLPSSENPPKSAGASGDVTLVFDQTAGTIAGTWNVGGPSGNITAAHIHQNALGANGPIVVAFTPLPTGGGRFSTTSTAVASQLIANILANPSAFYVNVHTDVNLAGETRGQLGCVASGRRVWAPLVARNASPN